ncbi:MAG: NAD(+)/NADH kinase [Candidatus Micrarchaeota archaeon]|nr:NAD(+)/NADH kinase [Candidatus Micrarchaeota archaeon]
MKRISTATVIANRKKPAALKAKQEVLEFLRLRGISISQKNPQLIITLGGDGTVLFSKKHYGKPFFSVGSKTSFICQATFSDWRQKLSRAISRGRIEKRLLLEASAGKKKLPLALNEVGIRNPQPRVLSVYLVAGGQRFAFRADGLIFSTPTGSPAYCYSCGGRQMNPKENSYQAVAIAPFRRAFEPLILSASRKSSVWIVGKEPAQIFVDGQVVGWLSQKHPLRVRVAAKKFLFLKTE